MQFCLFIQLYQVSAPLVSFSQDSLGFLLFWFTLLFVENFFFIFLGLSCVSMSSLQLFSENCHLSAGRLRLCHAPGNPETSKYPKKGRKIEKTPSQLFYWLAKSFQHAAQLLLMCSQDRAHLYLSKNPSYFNQSPFLFFPARPGQLSLVPTFALILHSGFVNWHTESCRWKVVGSRSTSRTSAPICLSHSKVIFNSVFFLAWFHLTDSLM